LYPANAVALYLFHTQMEDGFTAVTVTLSAERKDDAKITDDRGRLNNHAKDYYSHG
jgi:hypothetical protein